VKSPIAAMLSNSSFPCAESSRRKPSPAVYRWREINHGRLSQIELDALEPKAITLHACCFAAQARRELSAKFIREISLGTRRAASLARIAGRCKNSATFAVQAGCFHAPAQFPPAAPAQNAAATFAMWNLQFRQLNRFVGRKAECPYPEAAALSQTLLASELRFNSAKARVINPAAQAKSRFQRAVQNHGCSR